MRHGAHPPNIQRGFAQIASKQDVCGCKEEETGGYDEPIIPCDMVRKSTAVDCFETGSSQYNPPSKQRKQKDGYDNAICPCDMVHVSALSASSVPLHKARFLKTKSRNASGQEVRSYDEAICPATWCAPHLPELPACFGRAA